MSQGESGRSFELSLSVGGERTLKVAGECRPGAPLDVALRMAADQILDEYRRAGSKA